jgi:hypothetical protein
MQINAPCIITARLLPGIQIDGVTISIERDGTTADDRDRFRVYIDGPGLEYESTDQASGVGGGTLWEGLQTTLSFLGACGESVAYSDRHPGHVGDNADLYPREIGEWAADHQDELYLASEEITAESIDESEG